MLRALGSTEVEVEVQYRVSVCTIGLFPLENNSLMFTCVFQGFKKNNSVKIYEMCEFRRLKSSLDVLVCLGEFFKPNPKNLLSKQKSLLKK